MENNSCPLCDIDPDNKPRVVPPQNPNRIDGRIIFTPTVEPSDPRGYARWVSTGQACGTLPEYSIQRFSYRTDGPGRRGYETEPYHRVYYKGATIRALLTGNDEWINFHDACAACDLHFHTNRSD